MLRRTCLTGIHAGHCAVTAAGRHPLNK
jgi:hypothetical protein